MKEAIRSIKDSFSRSVFYWLTFVLTSMFMFVFFNLSYSDAVGVTFINAKNNASLLITVLVIGVCMVVIFFANDFYVKKKSKDLGIRLVCGATFMQLAFHTLFQTLVLFLLAIPVGILLAIGLIPMIQGIIESIVKEAVPISIMPRAIFSTALIILVEIVFCTVLNVGYVFRSTIAALINEKAAVKIKFKIPFVFFTQKTKQILYTILFILPIIIMYLNHQNEEGILVFGVIGMVGFYGFMSNTVIPFLNNLLNRKLSNSEAVAYIGLIRNNLKVLSSNVILIVVSDVLIISILTNAKTPIETIVCLVSFVVINILLTLSIMFKFTSEIVGRKKHYAIMSHIGYTIEKQRRIMMKEVIGFYGIIIGLSLFYLFNIMMILVIQNILQFSVMGWLLALYVLPFIFTMLCSYIYYYKEVWGKDV